MANFLHATKLNRLLLSSTIVTFSLSTLPHPVYATHKDVTINEILFATRVEKLIEKINKYRDRGDINKLLGAMFDLKLEVETYTGKKIDLDKQLDQIEKDIKANGGKLEKNEMKTIRKTIKNKQKRIDHKTSYMTDCLEYEIPYNADEENFLFIARHGEERKDGILENDMPLRVTIGVTVALCGLFLYFVPFPICKVWAPELMKAGIALAVEGTINRVEDKKELIV